MRTNPLLYLLWQETAASDVLCLKPQHHRQYYSILKRHTALFIDTRVKIDSRVAAWNGLKCRTGGSMLCLKRTHSQRVPRDILLTPHWSCKCHLTVLTFVQYLCALKMSEEKIEFEAQLHFWTLFDCKQTDQSSWESVKWHSVNPGKTKKMSFKYVSSSAESFHCRWNSSSPRHLHGWLLQHKGLDLPEGQHWAKNDPVFVSTCRGIHREPNWSKL